MYQVPRSVQTLAAGLLHLFLRLGAERLQLLPPRTPAASQGTGCGADGDGDGDGGGGGGGGRHSKLLSRQDKQDREIRDKQVLDLTPNP